MADCIPDPLHKTIPPPVTSREIFINARHFTTHLPHVVHPGVYDHPPGQDVVDPGEGEQLVLHVNDRHALLVRQDVAEVAHVPVGVARRSVGELERVEVPLHGLAAVRGVSHLVDVEAVLTRSQSLDLPPHCDGAAGSALQHVPDYFRFIQNVRTPGWEETRHITRWRINCSLNVRKVLNY